MRLHKSIPFASRAKRRGFTLIEAALTTTIIGVGVLAMLQLLAAGTLANNEGAELTTGLNLAKNIRELSMGLAFADSSYDYEWDIYNPPGWGAESGETTASYDDLDDLHGRTFNPPIDARRQVLNNFTGWAQSVTVQSVDPDMLTANMANGTSPAIRVTVAVTRNGNRVCQLSWVTCDSTP